MFIEKIEELGFTLVSWPPYSLDVAPRDLFLFGCLRQRLEGKHFTMEDEVIAAIM
jgi:hypothetical protein